MSSSVGVQSSIGKTKKVGRRSRINYQGAGLAGSAASAGIGYLLYTQNGSEFFQSLGLLMGASGAFGIGHLTIQKAGLYSSEDGTEDPCSRRDELLTVIPTVATLGPMAYYAYDQGFVKTAAFIGVSGGLSALAGLSGYTTRLCPKDDDTEK